MIAWALPFLILCGSMPAAGAWRLELLDQAEHLARQGKHEEAAAMVQGVLADADKNLGPEDPEVGRILAELSRIYAMVGDEARLHEIEKRLSAFKPKDFSTWVALGRLLRRDGKPLEAEEALKKALAFKPGEIYAGYELALVYEDLGRFEEELPFLKKRIEKKPKDYFLYSQLASVYLRLGRFAEAKETFAKAKVSGGKIAGAYIAAGYFYQESGHPVQAKAAFESAIAVDTASPFGYHHLGVYFAGNKQYPEAEKYLRRALEMQRANPNTLIEHDLLHTMKWLGDVIAAQGRYAEAEAVYLKAIKMARPGGDRYMGLMESLAKLYVSRGKSRQAEEIYKRAVAASSMGNKSDIFFAEAALSDLGEFYLDQGRRAEAADVARRVEKLCADAPLGEAARNSGNLAQLYTRLGDDSKEAALFARLMPLRRTMPFNSQIVLVELGLANIAAAQGRFHEAEDHYREVIGVLHHNNSRKEEADVLDSLAALYMKAGNHAAEDEMRARAKSLRGRL